MNQHHIDPLKLNPDGNARDLFDMEDIQSLQDTFAASTGLSVQIVKADGTVVTRRSGEAAGEMVTFPLQMQGQAVAIWRLYLNGQFDATSSRLTATRRLLGMMADRFFGHALKRRQLLLAMGGKSMRAAALSAANRKLEARIERRTRDLAGSRMALEEKSLALEELNAALQNMNAEFESLNGELQDMNAMLEEEIQDRQRAEDEAAAASVALREANERLEQANHQLEHMNHQLEARVCERTEALLRANSRLEEEIRENRKITYHDSLTGLYNRRFFEEELKRLDVPRNLPLSVIMGDVNGLKLVNDAFGHQKGDELLRKAAAAIVCACRKDDIVARWGGDEFVVLLPKTSSVEAEDIVNRMRASNAGEHVNAVKVSLSYGWETKLVPEEGIPQLLKRAEDYMYKHKIIENEGLRSNAINTIISTLHEKNPREEQHSKRVSEICLQLATEIGLSASETGRIRLVGLLHDIGKIAIDEGILNKPGQLTASEWADMRRHPDIGYRILSTSSEMQEFAEIILAHHERWDGKGYPKGLRGEQIPVLARIIALADSFDAMTSERPYRRPMSTEAALLEIEHGAGTQFDPLLATRFKELMAHAAPPAGPLS
jgi:diguanylate cyclase (GGDEF)-like protein/putative nucleotidyltransferase with HDIG domain